MQFFTTSFRRQELIFLLHYYHRNYSLLSYSPECIYHLSSTSNTPLVVLLLFFFFKLKLLLQHLFASNKKTIIAYKNLRFSVISYHKLPKLVKPTNHGKTYDNSSTMNHRLGKSIGPFRIRI